ncbi:MAG: putative Ig domain-containing protein [Jaaginema sp. PMC 1079.18]|nr:putative Ig domain-containing protein [Jaaginema sp. PMC 1080.18]MEC4853820.1 putative Ig domain-containing protein [Jaaginema sp. PMC 1079.18]MEC4869130.1 putative Ig domain-containing protein [Jaaginema sp. PMC 1078.18]
MQAFTVELLEPNQNPSFTSTLDPEIQPQIGKTFTYAAIAFDADGDELTYELLEAPVGAAIDPQTGQLTWTPQTLGETTVTLKVSDGKGGEARQTLELEVIEAQANRSPLITSMPRTRSQTGVAYLYQIIASDPDGEALTYQLLEAPTGMTLDAQGQLLWHPEPSQMGNHTVTVATSDGTATATQTWTLSISDRDINNAPTITSTPTARTYLDRLYRYNLEGTDPDNDPILWTLIAAPDGAVIDSNTGRLSWQPSPEQLGEQTFAVRAMDTRGAYTIQEFNLQVTGTNLPPNVVSVPLTQGAVAELYHQVVVATDPEQEAITYRLNRYPEGMSINAQTGEIQWTPQSEGSYNVEVQALDASGGTVTQAWTIEVGTTAVNLPPSITSTPIYSVRSSQPYSYQVIASDPDNATLNYELLNANDLPPGITLNSSGELTWDNPVAGTYTIVIGANDGSLGAAQAFTLTVRDNSVPTIVSTPNPTTNSRRIYRYDVIANDPESDTLTYALENAPAGMNIDELGRITWQVPQDATGNTTAQIIVTDSFGGEARQTINLEVVNDTQPPSVLLQPASNVYVVDTGNGIEYQVDISSQSTVSLRAVATDNLAVDSLQLLVNGTAVAQDSNGIATIPVGIAGGTLNAVAIATDTAGNTTQETLELKFVDLSISTDLTLDLDLSNLPEVGVTNPIDIIGTVADNNGNPVSYTLEIQPINGGEWTTVFSGTQAVTNGVLGTFDPTLLPNDTYKLRLSATDATGNTTFTENRAC